MKYFHISVRDIARTLQIVPKVESFGHIYNHTDVGGITTYTDRIEFCLRISSPAPFAQEYFAEKEYHIEFPHLLVKVPGRARKVISEKGREAFYLIYSLSELEDFLRKISWQNTLPEEVMAEKCCRKLEITPRIQSILQELSFLADHTREPGNADRIDLLSYSLLLEFFLAEKNPSSEEKFYEAKIRKIASFLQLHFREKISLNLLAEENALSLRTLFRYWNRIFHDTPYNHLQDLRLAEACRLLETGDQPVSVIAERSGFSDASYFVRFFKLKYGLTPASYRKNKKTLSHSAPPLALNRK